MGYDDFILYSCNNESITRHHTFDVIDQFQNSSITVQLCRLVFSGDNVNTCDINHHSRPLETVILCTFVA